MTLLEAIVLGITQGLTEFLPISSSGHLRIIPAFAGWEDPGALFTAVIQLGTMAAVVIYFWRDLVTIASTWLRSLRRPELRGELDARMGWYLIIATIPIGLVGLAFKDQIETGARNLYLIGTFLIVAGIILAAADRLGRKVRELESVGRVDAIWIGIAQAFALIPGTSRSGATITAGLFLGMKREAAARFSFLLSIPAVVLSGLFGLTELASGDSVSYTDLTVATVFAFIFGYLSIAFLLRYLATPLDDDLRLLPARARRPGHRPRRRRDDQLELDDLELAAQIDQLEDAGHGRRGCGQAERAPGAGRGGARLEQRAQAGGVHEIDGREIDHDRARALDGAAPPAGGARP